MTQSEVTGVTETVFDDRLPGGIADYWNTCMSKSRIWAQDKQLDLHGSCPKATNVASVNGQVVYAAAAQRSPFGITIPLHLMNTRTELDDFPWPLQGCYVGADTNVVFHVLGFQALSGSWETRNGTPALRLQLTNPPSEYPYFPALRNTIATAICPSPINQGLLREKLDKSRINGLGNITFKKLNLNVYLLYALKNDKIAVTADVEPDFSGLDVDIDWDKLPASAKTSFLKQIDSLDRKIADQLKGYFTPLGPIFADAMATAIPKGHRICDLTIRKGTLVIETDDAGSPLACKHIRATTK